VQHELITCWEELANRFKYLPKTGIRVLEVRTNRKRDVMWRKENLVKFGNW
jgi:2-succinyl-5-enolpyruvyl-6-hydroxy-3-cyclohexene-1-carboxylate synthase